jgi:hypothetical protein
MLKTVAAAIAISIAFACIAPAQTVRAPDAAGPAGMLLIKHDKEDNGRGRKLGHYKHRGREHDQNEADDEDRTRRPSARSSRGGNTPSWVDPTPAPYYAPPGYGNSYPPAPYGYYPQPYRAY